MVVVVEVLLVGVVVVVIVVVAVVVNVVVEVVVGEVVEVAVVGLWMVMGVDILTERVEVVLDSSS